MFVRFFFYFYVYTQVKKARMMDLIAYLLLQTSWQLITETKSDKHLFCCDECTVNNTVRAAMITQFQSFLRDIH